jgi:hypothetical protein
VRIVLVLLASALMLWAFFISPVAALALVLVALVLVAIRRRRRAATIVAGAWGFGGALLALGSVELAWRENVNRPLLWVQIGGGVLITLGVFALPVAVRGRGAWAVALGLFLMVLGWATLWAGVGIVPLAIGVTLYLFGAVRTGAVPGGAAATLVLALLGASLAVWLGAGAFAGFELGSLAAVTTGAGLYVRASAASR